MTTEAITEETKLLLLQAVWELDKLARILPGLVPLDDDMAHYAIKGVSGRIVRLTSALMSGLQGDAEKADIKQIINFDDIGQG